MDSRGTCGHTPGACVTAPGSAAGGPSSRSDLDSVTVGRAAMILVSKTYWAGMPFWFRRPPEGARIESLALTAHDLRQARSLLYTPAGAERPRVGGVILHPRVDFTHHYAGPRLVQAGFGVLAANTRHVHSDLFGVHEEMVLDLAACVRHLKEKRGVEKVVLFANCGGGSLAGLYQAQASSAPAARLTQTPAGDPTHFEGAPMTPADLVVFVAAHRGQGKILMDAIDPAVVDEHDPTKNDPALDMYSARNGFREPPAPSTYAPDFLARYRAAQEARVRRIDAIARAQLARQAEARAESEAPGFEARSFDEREDVLRRRVYDGVMVVHRTMANPSFVDPSIEPSGRDYGSLLSERPDLMNMTSLGLARTVTPRAWLSTWSGVSSQADLVANARAISAPTLIVHAANDREVHLEHDVRPVFDACGASDKRLVVIDGARHYFEPDLGEKKAPHVETLMDVVVPWIQERAA